ncbi:hypothetical protein H6P81_003978 [Aristolochia fimbriata]|uniref:Pectinesterase catalytic domain-containing protein n=1 Tax=Aristolochia fimbriata TaxID=158543 RepID=A0AAV7FE40_ARIFI|nr:hypothetical protein H6P81_003978 [Aristolochia fimbriata]
MDRVSRWIKCCFSLLLATAALLTMTIDETLLHPNHDEKHPSLAPLPQPPLSPVVLPQPPAPEAPATVAKDGTGHFLTISDAVEAASNYSVDRYRIHIKGGRYEDLGFRVYRRCDGQHDHHRQPERRRWVARDGHCHSRYPRTWVRGRQLDDGERFGSVKGFGLALICDSSEAAFYGCRFSGYHGTLEANSQRQFYKDCTVEGSHLLLHGGATALFQSCAFFLRTPIPGLKTNAALTGHRRLLRFDRTGFSLQNCSVKRAPDYDRSPSDQSGRIFLGEDLGPAARVVFLQSYLDGIVSPGGWIGWGEDSHPDRAALNAAYFGEYLNYGPGADIRHRNRSSGFVAIKTPATIP